MSKYTTEVRYICEKYAGLDVSADYLSIGEVIERARGTIFNFDYPIFDESYRSVLETKILKHFYTREIGEESVGLWKLRLETRMNEIMPYYNQRYASELITFNPLFDTDLTTSRDDTFGSQKRDDNIHNTVNGGQDINDNHLVKGVADGGTDANQLGGTDTESLSGADANEEGGATKLKYLGKARRDHKGSDTDTYQDIKDDNNNYPSTESTTDSWHNVDTVDMHYESDTPQSTIGSIDDTNYATAFTKDTHKQKNTGLTENSENFDRVKETVKHKEHHSNTTAYDSHYEDSFTDRIDQTEHGKTDTTYYGKVDSTTYGKTDTTFYGKTEDTDQSIHDVLQFGKTTRFDERNKQDFNSTDKWLEKMVGKRNSKSYSQMLNEFRTTFLNIDMEIINELNDLFFNLW